MPEASSYKFTHKELVEMMIKKIDLHEGRWMLMATFGFGAINGGPSSDEVVPTGMVGLQALGIQQATNESPASLVADAAEVNPALKNKPKEKRADRDT
jgi:hypothetical protein